MVTGAPSIQPLGITSKIATHFVAKIAQNNGFRAQSWHARLGVPIGWIRACRPGPVGSSHLDEMSKAIIEKLQHDGRRSHAGIGKAVLWPVESRGPASGCSA